MTTEAASAGGPAALARRHLLSENELDLEGAMAVFTDDCIYEIPALGVSLRGREAVANHHAAMFETFPDWCNEAVEFYDAPRRAFARIRVARTHRRPWGPFAATGRRVVTHSLAEFPLAPDELLAGETVHLNPLEALHQIGALPTDNAVELALVLRAMHEERGVG